MQFNQHENYRERSGVSSLDWYKSYPWLVLCTTRSRTLCSYCSSCHKRGLLTEKVPGGGDAFLTTGFDNWKKAQEYFMQHAKSHS